MIYSLTQVQQETRKYFQGDDLATNIWIKKYCLKNEVGNLLELSPDDMHKRLASEFSRIESNYPNPISENTIYDLLKDFKYVVPQGSPMYGIGNSYVTTSLSNCFVIGNNDNADSYGSILRTDEEQIQLMKRRGGVGHDISHLRPSGTLANNSVLGGLAGATLYMERFSNSTREVAQDGRRGALMLSIDCRHPDADRFIDMKLESGKVTGANVSVKISDEFMDAVNRDAIYWQCYPIDLKIPLGGEYDKILEKLELNKLTALPNKIGYVKAIKAKELWNKIIKNAHKSAEPGVLFWDTILKESPADCYGTDWKSVSTNPCIVGDTLIAVADGRNAVSIKQLVEENKDVLVYSNNPKTLKTEIKWGRNPRLTKEKAEVWKLILDDNSELIATPDHKIMLKDGFYCDLSKLKIGQSINPFCLGNRWLAFADNKVYI